MFRRKIIIFILTLIFSTACSRIYAQESQNYRINQGQVLSSASHTSSGNYLIYNSTIGKLEPVEATSSTYILNGGVKTAVAIDVLDGLLQIPSQFSLEQNYPNPFNPTTNIHYGIVNETHVSLKVFDALGRQVRLLYDGKQTPGIYTIVWDAKDENGTAMPSGIYYYRIITDEFSDVRKMMLIK